MCVCYVYMYVCDFLYVCVLVKCQQDFVCYVVKHTHKHAHTPTHTRTHTHTHTHRLVAMRSHWRMQSGPTSLTTLPTGELMLRQLDPRYGNRQVRKKTLRLSEIINVDSSKFLFALPFRDGIHTLHARECKMTLLDASSRTLSSIETLLCLDGERVEGQVRGSRAWKGGVDVQTLEEVHFLRPAGRAEE